MFSNWNAIKAILVKERRILASALLAGFVFTLAAGILVTRAYSDQVSGDIAKELIRFHVRANSDSDEDLQLKEQVRERVLGYLRDELSASSSKAETCELLYSRLEDVEEYARTVINDAGYDYNVSVEITKEFFPTKIYGDIALPAGEYEALRIDIGEAEGMNWWCVMFPPLCYVDVTRAEIPDEEKERLRELMDGESYSLISEAMTGDNLPVTVKFKIVELWQNLKPEKEKQASVTASIQLPRIPSASSLPINYFVPENEEYTQELDEEPQTEVLSEVEVQPDDSYELLLLASIINGEARGEAYDGQVAVGAVVMNRVAHPSFPDTIEEVIYQNGAFDAVRDGQINLVPTESCIQAARDALAGNDPTNGALYYWNPKTATSRWIRNVTVTMAIGNHNFGMH